MAGRAYNNFMKLTLIMFLIPLCLLAEDPKPAEKTDPITDKMRFDLALAQRDFISVKAQEEAALARVTQSGQAMKAACDGVGQTFNPQVNQFQCVDTPLASQQRTGATMAQADPSKSIIPPSDSSQQAKKQKEEKKKKEEKKDDKKQ